MMKEYSKALAEVSEILKYTQKEVIDKIPQKFLDFIEKNKDKEHKLVLKEDKNLLEQDLKPETKEIIALIYRDYVCSQEERENIIKESILQREKIEKEKNEKYKIDFDKIKEQRETKVYNSKEDKMEEKSLTMIKEEKWYKKIIKKILELFTRKK